jgi:hypothetical protein
MRLRSARRQINSPKTHCVLRRSIKTTGAHRPVSATLSPIEEGAMAKAKRRVGKKASKRRKQPATSARKRRAKQAAPKKPRSKVRKAARGARKVAAKKRPGPKSAARKVVRKLPPPAELPVEDTIVDVVDEPAPGVVRVTEYETIRTVRPGSGDDSEDDQE